MEKKSITALVVGAVVILFVGYLVIKGTKGVANSMKGGSVDDLMNELGGGRNTAGGVNGTIVTGNEN